MKVQDEFDDFVLRWPRESFKQRAAVLLNERDESEWTDRVEWFLEDTFVSDTARERFQQKSKLRPTPVKDPWATPPAQAAPWDESKPALADNARFLADLLKRADSFQHPGLRRPYYSERRAGSHPHALGLRSSIVEFHQLIRDLDSRGYFAMRLGIDCADDPDPIDPVQVVEMQSGRTGLWPIDVDALAASPDDPDDFLDLVEILHDLVAQPRRRSLHGWSGCTWHYSDFSISAGRHIYRWSMNRILDASDLGLRLAEEGEDRGRLVASTDEARTELTRRMTARLDPSTGERVRHAVALFRRRGASEHDKRSACIALAGILEERRGLAKEHLHRKDEGALFQIANGFAIRHQDSKQLGDYDPMFLDWVFWYYLATVELTDRLLARPDAPAS